MYRLFIFQTAIENNNTEALKTLISEDNKDVIADLAMYQTGEKQNSQLLTNFATFQEGYQLLRENKVDEASLKFQMIPTNSQLMNLVNSLEHFQVKK
ncbi:MAG: hypothetical protein ACK5LP_09860 [Campylobacteraceae bacterium]